MRMKKLTLLTLTMLLSVVAFAQSPKAGQRKVLTPYQQALQAVRSGQLSQTNASPFEFSKPMVPALQQKARFQKTAPSKSPLRAATSYTYSFVKAFNGWTTIDADGDGHTWELSSDSGHNDSNGFLRSESYVNGTGPLTPDNYLVSPKMKLDGKITFYACAQDADYPSEVFGVFVSTASGTNASDFQKVQQWTMTAAPSLAPASFANGGAQGPFRSARRARGMWYEYTVDLSSYAGAEGYVAIRHYDCTDQYVLNVDDITLETSQLIDAYDPDLEVADDPVVVAPSDELVTPPSSATVTTFYTIGGKFYLYSSGWVDATADMPSVEVAIDGSDIYIKGLAYYFEDAWIKGTINGTTATFASGQLVGEDEYGPEYIVGSNNGSSVSSTIVFTISDAGQTLTSETALILESESATAVLAYTYWQNAVFSSVAPEVPTPVEVPAGLQTEEWLFKSVSYSTDDDGNLVGEEYNLPVFVGFDGDDVYVQGVCEDMPETWIKGTRSGNTVTFATGQYFGTINFYGIYVFDYFFKGYGAGGVEDVVMNYDEDNKTLTMVSPIFILIDSKQNSLDPNLILGDVVITQIPDVAATPAQPEITDASLSGTYPNISVNIPLTDKDGNPILSSKLSYQYYIDINKQVSPLTLTTDLYMRLDEDMTEIPYNFTDDYDVYNYRLYLNQDISTWNKIGIQSIYRGGDAENKSEISWFTLQDYVYEDVKVDVAAGADVAQAVAEATEGKLTKSVTVNLTAGQEYTTSAPIEIGAGTLTINGNGATIDASANAEPFVLLSATPTADFLNGTDYYGIQSIKIDNVTVKGVKNSIFYDNNKKYCVVDFTINNSIFELATEATKNQAFVSFQQGGAKDFTMKNSTVYQTGADENNYFLRYNNSARLDRYGYDKNSETQSISYQNNTFYKVGKNGQWGNYNGIAGQNYSEFHVTDNIWFDCGNGQIARRLLGGRNASSYKVCEFNNNTYFFNGAAETGNESYDTGTQLTDDPGFTDAENGDFHIGEVAYSEQVEKRTGDPRWLTQFKPSTTGEPFEFELKSGTDESPVDLAAVLKDYYQENLSPAYITIKLAPEGKYIISEPLDITTTINIIGDDEDPAYIDATALGANPFIQLSSTLLPAYPANEKGFYFLPGNVVLKNVDINNLQGQLFYANKQKYIIDYLTVDNCNIHMKAASKKTIFDFNGGGYVNNITVNNSTLSADKATQWQNGGFYSTQSGTRAADAGVSEKQHIAITNSTLFNIASGRTTSTLRENSKDYMNFEVVNSLIVNSGKKGEFVKGLNAGQNDKTPNWNIVNNSFQWPTTSYDTDGRLIYEDVSSKEEAGASNILFSGSVEGEVKFMDDAAADEGNLSLAESAPKTAEVGDPRWLFALKNVTMADIADAQNDLSYIINTGLQEGYNTFVLPEPADTDPYLYLKTLSPLKVDRHLIIKSNPKVRINAGENAEPFIVLSKEPAVQKINDYYRIRKIQLDGLWVICMRNSIVWDQNVKYCVADFKIRNSVLSMTPLPGDIDGMPERLRTKDCKFESLIAFEAGGIKDFTIKNSTVCDNKEKAVAKYFIRYNNSARLDRYGFDKDNDFQTMTYLNNTFFGMLKADGQWGNYNGIQGQAYSKFNIQNNIWYNCGKDIIRRLSGGRFNDNAPRTFSKNTYVNDGAIIDESGYDKSETALNTVPKFKFEVTNIYTPDYFHYDDYTLTTSCAQSYYKTGDPRWVVNGGYADGYHYNPKTGEVEADSRGGEGTAIEAVETTVADGEWYTIQGVRVDKPAKGLYIHNGKKVVLK